MNEQRNGQAERKPQPLYVTLILDETGSMMSCKGAAIAGFNQYVATLRHEPAETWFTLTLFNSRKTEIRYRGVPVTQVKDLDVETYRPDSTTPLYDAIGRTLSAAKQEVPGEARKLCVILTDGEENASREYNRAQIFAMIKAFEHDGWRFLYLGADHDVWAAGESLGIAGDGLVSFCRRTVDDTFDQLSEATADYRRGKRRSEAALRIKQDTPSPSGRCSEGSQPDSAGHEKKP